MATCPTALLPVAAALRWAAAEFSGVYLFGVIGSGAIWITAFALYLVALWPIFFGPRADTGAEA